MRRWWGHHFVLAESVTAVIAGLLFAFWQSNLGGASAIDSMLKSNQAALYGTLATIWGALLGFAIASTSIILSYGEGSRMKAVTEHASYAQLGNVLRLVNPVLAVATLAALGALLLDRDSNSNHIARDLVFTTSLLAVLSLARTIWILDNIVRIATRPSRARTGEDP